MESPPPSPPVLLVPKRQRSSTNNDNLRDRSISVRLSQARGDETDISHQAHAHKHKHTLLGKGISWTSARSNMPPSRKLQHLVRSPRFWLMAVLLVAFFALSSKIGAAIGDMHKYSCFGPSNPPMAMTANEAQDWHADRHTPVLFNHHKPVEINATSIAHVDLNGIDSTPSALQNKERVLVLTPIRDAVHYLPKHFDLLAQLTYPHALIDLAFLVGDTSDDTLAAVALELERIQADPATAFHSTMIVEKNFGVAFSQKVDDRHAFQQQASRRRAMGRARNYLLSAALKPEHSWVYWRDVDIVESPPTIIEDFVAHDRDILVPNVWFHRYEEQNGEMVDIEGRFDYNSWQETPDSIKLASTLPKDVILAEGYKEYETNRKYMALMGNWRQDKDREIALDGIGGVNIIVKADVHRSGINFPCYAFENQAETEGFAKMAKRAGYGVYGLPNYIVWHIDTQEKPGNAKEEEKQS